jgi:hypothetical protein
MKKPEWHEKQNVLGNEYPTESRDCVVGILEQALIAACEDILGRDKHPFVEIPIARVEQLVAHYKQLAERQLARNNAVSSLSLTMLGNWEWNYWPIHLVSVNLFPAKDKP